MIIDEISDYLYGSSDDTKRAFNRRILHTNYEVIGGTIPTIKKIARYIVREGLSDSIIENRDKTSYEIVLLRGFVISYDNSVDEETKLSRLDAYLDDSDNWSHIDSIASSMKCKDDIYHAYLTRQLGSFNEWHIRYGIVGLMMNYYDEDVVDSLLRIIGVTKHTYYIDMAIAWAIQLAYAKRGRALLSEIDLEILPANIKKYAVSKVRDSLKIFPLDKDYFKSLLMGK